MCLALLSFIAFKVRHRCLPFDSMESKPLSPYQNALSGSIAGVTARLFIAPLDVVKIRLQLQSQSRLQNKYRNISQSLALIWKEEGIHGLFKVWTRVFNLLGKSSSDVFISLLLWHPIPFLFRTTKQARIHFAISNIQVIPMWFLSWLYCYDRNIPPRSPAHAFRCTRNGKDIHLSC